MGCQLHNRASLVYVPFNTELNTRVDKLREYRRGHKKLAPLGVVSSCWTRRDGFRERLALLFET